MLERLSDPARRATAQAEAEARRLHHGHVGTEHLMLGILASGHSSAARVLVESGLTLDACRDKVVEAVASKLVGPATDSVELTDRAKRALERAGRLSLRRGAERVGTVPVMLSVLEVEGTAGQVLRGLSVDLAALRLALEAAGDDHESRLPPDSSGTAVPARSPDGRRGRQADATCPACGGRLNGALAHRVLTSRGEDGTTRELIVVYCSACGSAVGTSPA